MKPSVSITVASAVIASSRVLPGSSGIIRLSAEKREMPTLRGSVRLGRSATQRAVSPSSNIRRAQLGQFCKTLHMRTDCTWLIGRRMPQIAQQPSCTGAMTMWSFL